VLTLFASFNDIYSARICAKTLEGKALETRVHKLFYYVILDRTLDSIELTARGLNALRSEGDHGVGAHVELDIAVKTQGQFWRYIQFSM